MTRKMIINELLNRDYSAEAHNVIKNGIELEGIRILTGSNTAPVIYTQEIIDRAEEKNMTLDDVVSAVISIYKNSKSLEFNINEIFEKNFILSNLYIGLQKESAEDIVKRPCGLEGIESYLYIRLEADQESYSLTVSKELLERVCITEGEAWEMAGANTDAETELESMEQVMADILGCECTGEINEQTAFFVLTNKSKVRGASAILNKKVLAEFGERYHISRIVVLPSSIHEMILIPYTDKTDIDQFSAIVGEINNTEVDPTERLTDRAYVITI